MTSSGDSVRSSDVSTSETSIRILKRPSQGRQDGPRMYKHLFKILVLGDSGVGKSCLLTRFSDGRFSGTHHATVGVDFKMVTVELAGSPVKLQFWDTAGEERYRALLTAYFRGTHGVLLVYDTTSMASFRSLERWLAEINRHCREQVSVHLVGTKCDELHNRVVSVAMGARYATDHGLGFREGSAKSGINVDDIFMSLALAMYDTLVIERPLSSRLEGDQGGGQTRRTNPPRPAHRHHLRPPPQDDERRRH